MSSEKGRRGLDLYWYIILGTLLIATAVYIYHLLTTVTPNRVFLHIPVLELDVYWYAIAIVGGILLGAYVVSKLAEEKALAIFDDVVPEKVQQRPLTNLSLPNEITETLQKQKIDTLGDLLLRWGYSPRNLGLNADGIVKLRGQLSAQSGVNKAWLEDAPWRIWNPDHVWGGIAWVVILGIIGARLYHILTPSPSMAAVGIESPLDYLQNPYQLINLRNGGLGIYGAIAGGLLGLFIYTRTAKIPFVAWADLAVIGMALGQVFGRWGNFFNQELYGKPSNLPWAVNIDLIHRLPDYAEFSRFHPAFLYESLWNLFAFFVLIILLKRYSDKLLTGDLLALYLIFYAVGRILLEFVRLDSRLLNLGGLSLNMAVATFVSLIVALLAAGWRVYAHKRVRKD